jgi:hypothetical protein
MAPAISDLILARRVIGTPVRNEKERIGHIADVAIGKQNGMVAFAILSVGGFLGLGEKYHPVPWADLSYDTAFNGYVIALDKETLQKAPSFLLEDLADVGDSDEKPVSYC